MSSAVSYGKDKVIFATKEDHKTPSTVTLPEPERPPGLILPNGDINWNCPCLGGMATGPCGVEFRESFSCFHYSTNETKGGECYETFAKMQQCFARYPGVYKMDEDDNDLKFDDESKAESGNSDKPNIDLDAKDPENSTSTSVADVKK